MIIINLSKPFRFPPLDTCGSLNMTTLVLCIPASESARVTARVRLLVRERIEVLGRAGAWGFTKWPHSHWAEPNNSFNESPRSQETGFLQCSALQFFDKASLYFKQKNLIKYKHVVVNQKNLNSKWSSISYFIEHLRTVIPLLTGFIGVLDSGHYVKWTLYCKYAM